MKLRVALTDTFIDPISHTRMTDPVINDCGHTFERGQLNGWNQKNITPGSVPLCPLCKEPIKNLVPNMLIQYALEILDSPDNEAVNNISELFEEDQMTVQRAIQHITDRRTVDISRGIPDRLPKPQSYLEKILNDMGEFSKKAAENVSEFYCGDKK